MSYCIQATGPAGRVHYACEDVEGNFRLVGNADDTSWYETEDEACEASDRAVKAIPGLLIFSVFSTEEFEGD